MTRPRRVLGVSPHLDDAALSVGATLADHAAAGSDVIVCTLFAGAPREPLSPVARGFHTQCGLAHDASAVAVRIAEDQAAMDELGVRARHCSFLDAVYRRAPDGRWLCRHEQAMFDELPLDQDNLLKELTDEVDRVVATIAPDLVLSCAAIGRHVDHRLTRTAVSQVTGRTGVLMLLWEDLPYAMAEAAAAEPCRLVRPARPDAWSRKWRAIRRYRSQVRMLWPDGTDWVSELLAHAEDRGDGHPAEMFFSVDQETPRPGADTRTWRRR